VTERKIIINSKLPLETNVKMSTERGISLIMGTGGGFFAAGLEPTVDSTQEFLSLLTKYGIDEIDTAAVYPGGKSGRSETLLGQTDASAKFIIDTKIMVGASAAQTPDKPEAGELSREKVLESFKISIERLRVEKVRTLYCHRPDYQTPLEETASVFDELYKQGKFEHVCNMILFSFFSTNC
jgi:aryl-alcohol dehydrogenase-like predicted oxidoreductase